MFYCYNLETQTQWQTCLSEIAQRKSLCPNTICVDDILPFFSVAVKANFLSILIETDQINLGVILLDKRVAKYEWVQTWIFRYAFTLKQKSVVR